MGLLNKKSKIKAIITPEGISNLKELLQVSSDKASLNYSMLILTRINKCLNQGLWFSDYYPISRIYKVKQLKSFRPLFKNLIEQVFIPYRNKYGNETYLVGKYCKYYRLNPSWVSKYVSFYTEIKLTGRKPRDSKHLNSEIRTGVLSSLSQLGTLEDSSTMSISIDFAYKVSKFLIEKHLELIGSYKYSYSDAKDNCTRSMVLYPGDTTIATSILVHSFYVKNKFEQQKGNQFDTFRAGYEGRLYHPFVLFPKNLYRFVRFRGEPLIEIDLANSLPLLILNSIINSQRNPKHFLYGQNDAIKFIEKSNKFSTSEQFLCNSLRRGTFYTDVHKLIQPDGSNAFYQKMKGYVKVKVSEALYGDRNNVTRMKTYLIEHFPSFMELIHMYKSEAYKTIADNWDTPDTVDLTAGHKKTARKASNDSLVIYGMRKESTLFIDNILPALYKLNIPALPKHDAILVPQSYTKSAIEIISQVLDNELGKGNYNLKLNDFQ